MTCPCCGGEMYSKRLVYVDLRTNRAHVGGKEVRLPPMQAEVLHVLATAWPQPVHYDTIMARVQGSHDGASEGSLKVHISKVREAIRPLGASIECLWKWGYRLIEAPAQQIAAE